METVITVATIAAATFVFLLYVAFVRWRIKVHRARKEAREAVRGGVDRTRLVELTGERGIEDRTPGPHPVGAASLGGVDSAAADPDPGDALGSRGEGPPADRPPPTRGPHGTTSPRIFVLADAVSGIRLGEAFTPLVDVRPRPHAVDRAVFSSGTADVAAVRNLVTEALVAIGYEVTWTGLDATVVRDDAILAVAVVAEPTTAAIDGELAYPGAMLGNVVVDFWIPA